MKTITTLILSIACIVNAYSQDSLRINGHYSLEDSLNYIFLKAQSFTDINGKVFTMNDLKGKAVVFHFFETPAKSSTKSMLDLYRVQDQYKKDVVVVAIDLQHVDNDSRLKDFMVSNQYNFVYVPGKEIARELSIQKIPYKVFINKEGHLVQAYSGAYPDVREYERNLGLVEKCLSSK